ncbi:hypothetical protein M2305_003273 [Gluconobacter cerinus]|uniref:hypothetical protein n=1 Tax=Gluconobacter cerinus TaxID=38307 RepID=UPI002226F896|nr:hypothetical protein [Gluconobacter cerinus]MCW2267254.1 hypothetical protein [Gluconobacter cerinus]
MIKKIAFGIMCLALTVTQGACSEVQAQKAAISGESLLAVLEKASAQYIAGDFGTPDAQTVSNIKAYDAIAYADIVKIRTAAQAGTTISAAETLAATTAVTVFEDFLVSKKIISAQELSN